MFTAENARAKMGRTYPKTPCPSHSPKGHNHCVEDLVRTCNRTSERESLADVDAQKGAALSLGLFRPGDIEYLNGAPAGGEPSHPFHLGLDPRKSWRKQLLGPPTRHDHKTVVVSDD